MAYNKETLKDKLIKFDKTIVILVYILVIISTIFVYSASRSMSYVYKNLMWIGVGTFIIILSLFIDYSVTKKYIWYLYGFSYIILISVMFFGKKTLGAQRWISVGGIQLQPSEFVKIIIVMVMSYWIIVKLRNGINNIFDMFVGILPIIPILFLLLKQPDLGTSLIICFSYMCILFLNDANMKPIIIIVISVMVLSIPVYKFVLSDYQKNRVEVFLNPEKDIKNKGWHVTQSKISIGSGGLTGMGILQGSQSRLKFLPEPQTDFIFSVISEETGFMGSSFLLFIYFYLIYSILRVSRLVEDSYGKLIIYGITGIFLAHVIVNVGMTLGLLPVTGKPLLFVSYGGSSMLSSFMLISLVESIKIHSE